MNFLTDSFYISEPEGDSSSIPLLEIKVTIPTHDSSAFSPKTEKKSSDFARYLLQKNMLGQVDQIKLCMTLNLKSNCGMLLLKNKDLTKSKSVKNVNNQSSENVADDKDNSDEEKSKSDGISVTGQIFQIVIEISSELHI